MSNRVIVVGAGIVGASLAYHLAARGQAVTLLDAGLPASGATGSSFAWIGRPETSDLPSAPLRFLALDEYRRLQRELPGLRISWSGSLTWDGTGDDSGDGSGEGSGEAGRPGGAAADVRAIEPGLVPGPGTPHHAPDDGALDPVEVTELLVAAAVERGAELRVGTPAIGLVRDGSAVTGVRTGAGVLPATTVVVAAGAGTATLCAGIGVEVPVESSPAVLVRLRATPGLVRTIVAGPELEVRQRPDGTLLLPLAYEGQTNRAALQDTAEAARRSLLRFFPGASDVEIVSAEIGWRPMPADGEPIVGAEPGTSGLYLAVMHAGVTLAAAAGRLAAEEITTGVAAPELAGCRPDRFV
ncbi:FAD-dependent oxidoreductase [Promicromonospora sp. MEB111]|uniref:NAD(P)/FAD-dependent oxidoreductase n=1 Tax=Promicromonospora sp. MEB111 TaxID=3040301 RepID=UPI00254E581B|nr:FAD-dependent oxidoreductase [Promicromonospora sp. MEB111]